MLPPQLIARFRYRSCPIPVQPSIQLMQDLFLAGHRRIERDRTVLTDPGKGCAACVNGMGGYMDDRSMRRVQDRVPVNIDCYAECRQAVFGKMTPDLLVGRPAL